MSTYNHVVILGRLREDPLFEIDPKAGPFAAFEVITRRSALRAGDPEASEATVRVTSRRRLAEFCAEFLKKGREVLVVGELVSHEGYGPRLEVHAREVKCLGKEGHGA